MKSWKIFRTDSQSVRRPWQSTWRPRDWPSLVSTSSLLLTFWTFCPMETNQSRCKGGVACHTWELLLCTNLPQVARHLAKLFDSMDRLKFEQGEDGEPTKQALGMWSKDGEYVDFNKPCKCVGQVETWLNYLLDTMQATIRHEFIDAVVTYEEKPRDQWIFDPPAQVRGRHSCVCVYVHTCILYTYIYNVAICIDMCMI